MGTFENIRKISPYFFGVMAVLLIAYFVFTSGAEDIAKQAMGDPATTPVAIVNGEKILRSEFEQKVQAQIDQQRNQQKDMAEVDDKAIRNEVFNQMIEEVLLRQAAEKVGVTVSDKELRELMLENPPDYLRKGFTDSAGNFNKALYQQLVTNPEVLPRYIYPNADQVPEEEKQQKIASFRNDLIIIQDYLRLQKLTERLISVVNASENIMSPNFIKAKYINETGSASVKYIHLDISQIDDAKVNVTDQELKSYYEKHKKQFKQKPSRKVKYVSFPIKPSKDDTSRAERITQRINEDLSVASSPGQKDTIFERNMDQFNGVYHEYSLAKNISPEVMSYLSNMQVRDVIGPVTLSDGTYFLRLDDKRSGQQVSVKASHILINFDNNKDSAKAEAMRILGMAKSGDDFANLARQYSQDKGSGMSGGDLGYFEKGQMVKEFEDAAFAANSGEIVGPIESQFGFHIIKVFDKTSDEIKYSDIRVIPKTSQVTINMLKRDALSFKQQVETGTNFDTLAKRLNLNALETPFFEKTRPILGSQYLTDMAFNSDINTFIGPIENTNLGYVLVQVVDERTDEFKPFEDVAEELKLRVRTIKKLDLIKVQADQLYKEVAQLQDLSQIQTARPEIQVKIADDIKNNGTVPGIGNQWAFTEKAFTLPLNQISQPIRGERAYFILQVATREIPDEANVKANLPEFRRNHLKMIKQSGYYSWMAKLRENAEIEDKRSDFYQEY